MLFHVMIVVALVVAGAFLQYKTNFLKYVGLKAPKTT